MFSEVEEKQGQECDALLFGGVLKKVDRLARHGNQNSGLIGCNGEQRIIVGQMPLLKIGLIVCVVGRGQPRAAQSLSASVLSSLISSSFLRKWVAPTPARPAP
jgi:hypothetical protein